jgi:hypothetical protein
MDSFSVLHRLRTVSTPHADSGGFGTYFDPFSRLAPTRTGTCRCEFTHIGRCFGGDVTLLARGRRIHVQIRSQTPSPYGCGSIHGRRGPATSGQCVPAAQSPGQPCPLPPSRRSESAASSRFSAHVPHSPEPSDLQCMALPFSLPRAAQGDSGGWETKTARLTATLSPPLPRCSAQDRRSVGTWKGGIAAQGRCHGMCTPLAGDWWMGRSCHTSRWGLLPAASHPGTANILRAPE